MFNIIKKDITTVQSGVVAHGCNCLGVQGAGVALAIARKWPWQETLYRHMHRNGVRPEFLGTVQFVNVRTNPDIYVANCFTQVHVGMQDGKPPASLAAIETCLRTCLMFCYSQSCPLYAPQIGCGLGGLDWETQVKPIYAKLAGEFPDVNFYVCTI